MGWYRRPSRLIFHAFRCYPPKLTTVKPILMLSRSLDSLKPKPSFGRWRFFKPICGNIQSSIHQCGSISRPFRINEIGGGAIAKSWFNDSVSHFIKQRRWYAILLVSGYGFYSNCWAPEIIFNYEGFETVPYSKRSHVVLLDWDYEKERGDLIFEKEKASFGDKVLPPDHPQSIKVQRIGHNIIKALNEGLKTEKVWSRTRLDDHIINLLELPKINSPEKLMGLSDHKNITADEDDEILDEKSNSRKHLVDLQWEFIVVDEDDVNTLSICGGKVVVFTGILEHIMSDDEIAALVGHEVAHVIARHENETISKMAWWMILPPFIFIPFIFYIMAFVFVRLPFSRRMEIEADYIGMLLMASAGYDPRVAPQFYDKLGQITFDLPSLECISTHPCCEKRVRLLTKTEVMTEAIYLYRKAWLR